MVATPKKIGSGSGAVKYFYFTEKNYECDKGWLSTKGCEILELRELTKENFANILDGKIIDPTINKPSHYKSTDAKVEENIIQLGRKTKEGIEHQAGQEIIFSAPKSVSIMHLVAKDARIGDAHKKAVESIVGYVERHMIYSRVQKDGVMYLEKTGNIAAAQYTHLTSRPPKSKELKEGEKNDASIKSNQIIPDPQLHSHVILANATKCKDGKWRSVVFEKIYEYQMFLGESYRMELAREIEKLGYTVKIFKDKKSNRWTFEIDGKGYNLSADIKKMSQRRQDIKDMSESEGRSDGKSMAHYAKITRDEKIEHSKERLEREWEKKVKDISALKDLVAEAKLKLENAKNDHQNNEIGSKQKIDYVMSYAEGLLSEYEAVWEYTKLMEGAIEKSANNFSIERLELEINKRSKFGQFIKPYNKNLDTLTTVGNLLAEKKCLMKFRELIGKDKPIMNQTEIRDNLRGKKLNLGQRDAVKLVLSTRDRVIGIQGSAGTGKTTTLNVIKELSENKGYELLGLAPTKSAATIMREVVNINAMTVHLFCGKYAGVIAGRGTEEGKKKMIKEFSNKIVVVDESSLIAGNKMNDLLVLSDKLKFKMVLLGDIKQLGAIEAGRPFYYLQDHGMKVAIIQNILRQQDKGLLSTVYEAEKSIDKDWLVARKGIESALNKLGKDNIISLKKEEGQVTNKDLASAAYGQWYKFYKQGESCYIVALSNPLKHEVNSLVRDHYVNVEESRDYVVLEKKKLAKVQMRESLFYKPVEDVLVFNKDYKEFKNGGYYIVTGKEGDHNFKLREYNNPNSHEYKFDLMALESIRDGVIEVFNQTTLKIAKGERIRWTRNSKTHNYIINGDSAIVQDINNKEVIIKTRAGEKKVLSTYSKEWLHIDHDYSGTSYAAQGKTEDNVVGIARVKEKYIDLSTQRAFYVTLSRGRKSAKLITDDYDNLSRSMASKSGDKTSGIEHISGKQRDNLEELKKSSREVYIARDTQNRSEIGQIEKTTDRMDFKVTNKGYDYHRAYELFVSDRRLIENTAREFFGDVNHKLSRRDNLRFGNKGSVSVNLTNGQWYDFKSGEGGSLFKLYNKTGNVLESNLIKRNIQKPVDKDLERANKIKRVEQISRDALVISKNTIAVNSYLKVHRKINLENIRLSTDIKSSNNLWSSESRSNHLGLVAIARDKSGKETAAQMIYLDNKTYNKNKSLDINKRTMGVLKGSFVELTQNSKSNNIFIAEGIETGLSIASSVKDSRVICALGISNMLSIEKYLKDEDKNKSIVVVADNDGNDSITIQIIDKAVVQLSEAGYKNVQLIKPKTIGYDFNDMLKVRGEKGIKVYTDELLKKAPDIKNRLNNLSKRIALSTQELSKIKKPFLHYRESSLAKSNWEKIKEEHGLKKALAKISENPAMLGKLKGREFVGIPNKERRKALTRFKSDVNNLLKIDNLTRSIKFQKQESEKIITDYLERKDFAKIKTKGHNREELSIKLEELVKDNLNITDNKKDYISIKKVIQKITDKIINYRNMYGIEVENRLKQQYYLEARYEAERESKWQKYVNEKNPIKTAADILKNKEIVERLVNIDSNLSDKNGIYYKPTTDQKILLEYKENTKNIQDLIKDLKNKGYGKQGTEFIAREIIKYKEKTGDNLPIRQVEKLCSISAYVEKNYTQLIKNGFNKDEARIVFNEGRKLFTKYDRNEDNFIINKEDIKDIQKQSKKDIEIDLSKTQENTNHIASIQNIQMNRDGISL